MCVLLISQLFEIDRRILKKIVEKMGRMRGRGNRGAKEENVGETK